MASTPGPRHKHGKSSDDSKVGFAVADVSVEGRRYTAVYPISGLFLAQTQPLPGTPWTLTVFSHIEPVAEISTVRAAVAGISALLLGLLAMLFNDRRRHLRERLAARRRCKAATNWN